MDERERHEAGMQVRRSVLGDAHVRSCRGSEERSGCGVSGSDYALCMGRDLDASRPAAAYAQPADHWPDGRTEPREELRLHMRAAANNGVTAEEIREVLLHCAIYCGVPAANSAFHAAREILNEQPVK